MMLTTPNGRKVRCEAHKRYAVVAERADVARVELRTNNFDNAKRVRAGGFDNQRFIFDLRTGEVIR